jgi:hypothetical protein
MDGINRARADVACPVAEAEHRTVGRRACYSADTDRAAGARDVLDNNRLTERSAHVLGQKPR